MATTICLDFMLFPDNTPMPPAFVLGGFAFAKLGGNDPFVNVSGGGKGLQFADPGLKVTPPVQFTRLSLTIGRFASDVHVKLIAASGAAVGGGVITAPNQYTTLNFRLRRRAETVVLTGGNNEGILAKICVTF